MSTIVTYCNKIFRYERIKVKGLSTNNSNGLTIDMFVNSNLKVDFSEIKKISDSMTYKTRFSFDKTL